MTKEEFLKECIDYVVQWMQYRNAEDLQHIFNKFFESNVCIPKGENRHPYADVLHELAEGADIEVKLDGFWTDYNCSREYIDKWEFRIKPSEPVYEYKVRINFKDGLCEHTSRYFTKQEFEDFGFPSSCELAEATKQERKQ